MSNSRFLLNPDTWSKLVNYLYPKKQPGSAEKQPALSASKRKIHVHIPDCVGYASTLKSEERIALLHGLAEWECDFTYYLVPKDQAALEAWRRDNKEFYEKFSDKIKLIAKWRESPEWKSADQKYDQYRHGERKDDVARTIQSDVRGFWERHKEVPVHQVEDHILQEVKDCLSWMTPQDSTSEVVNVLMYKYNVTQAMFDVFQNFKKLGYKEPLIHCQFSFQPNPAYKADGAQVKQLDSSSTKRIAEATAPRAIKKELPLAASVLQGDSDGAFERTLVFLTSKGQAPEFDKDFAAELLVRMHRIEKRSSTSTSPESKYAQFARDNADGHDDVVVHTIPLKNDSEVLAVGVVTEEDPSRVTKLELTPGARASLRRDSLLPAAAPSSQLAELHPSESQEPAAILEKKS